MKRKPMKEPESPPSMMMTSMIDVVFQLMIFFMIVTDLTQRNVEKLELPKLKEANPTKFNDPMLLIVNIDKEGILKINGQTYWHPSWGESTAERNPFSKLEELFNARRRMRKYRDESVPGDFVKYWMLIRADRSTDFEHIQRLLMMCVKYGGVTNVQFAAAVPKKV